MKKRVSLDRKKGEAASIVTGKTVLILERFSPAWKENKLDSLLRELKASLGCGGKVDGRTLEIQGDQPDRLQPLP